MIFKNHKKAFIAGFIVISLITGGYTASAVYPVHDSGVYAQIVAQIKKVTEQIKTIQQQIALQKQHLYDVSWGKIDPIMAEIEANRQEYNKLKKGVSGILVGGEDVFKSFKKSFYDFDDFDVKNESYQSLKSRMQNNRHQIAKLDRDTIILINHKQKELEASQKRVQKLTEELKTVKGSKDLGQIQALIDAETVYSQNLTNDINALKTKLEVIRNETKKLEKDAEDKSNELLAEDFKKASKAMKDVSEKQSGVTTLSPTFHELIKKQGKGWF